jgi:GrpB-like predicted nucleotidyltransferase (UPF0157 family)
VLKEKIMEMHSRGLTSQQIRDALKEEGMKTSIGSTIGTQYIYQTVHNAKRRGAVSAHIENTGLKKLQREILVADYLPAEKRIQIIKAMLDL